MNTPSKFTTFPGNTPSVTAVRKPRDPYGDLLRDTRHITRDQATARETWLNGLSLEHKEDLLFELEMLLKGVVAWGNPRNHPFRRPRTPARTGDFYPHLRVAHATLSRSLAICTQLLGASPNRLALGRYLAVGAADLLQMPSTREVPSEGPLESLAALRNALVVSTELMAGLLLSERIPFRLFHSSMVVLQREIERNPHFNPLYTLEFRPEFDRIRAADVLETLQVVEQESCHRLAALLYLSHFRLMRMADLLRATAEEHGSSPRAYALLAAIRAETRSLVHVFRTRAGSLMGEAWERDVLRVPSQEVRNKFEGLSREMDKLSRVEAALQSAASLVRVEVRRAMEVEVPPCDVHASLDDFARQCGSVATGLREVLVRNVVQMTALLRGSIDPDRLLGDRGARRMNSAQLRAQVWMFALVTRAFVAKARQASRAPDDTWASGASQSFVQDYLHYFRAVGKVLAWETEYPHADRLVLTLLSLRDIDHLDGRNLTLAIAECELFGTWLHELHERISQRSELREVPFDKSAAGSALMLHLLRV